MAGSTKKMVVCPVTGDRCSCTGHCNIEAMHASEQRRQQAAAVPNDETNEREEQLQTALERIAQWSDAYPPDIFPQPDAEYYRRANAVLRAHGMTLDRLSAATMRCAVMGVGRIAKEALGTMAEQPMSDLKCCAWMQDADGNWDTSCGRRFVVIEGSPAENGMTFCCYCGQSLMEVIYARKSVEENQIEPKDQQSEGDQP